MKISKLRGSIKDLAEKRRSQRCKDLEFSDYLTDAFWWYDTPEGYDYWKTINDSMFYH